jgi:hypothetical protein
MYCRLQASMSATLFALPAPCVHDTQHAAHTSTPTYERQEDSPSLLRNKQNSNMLWLLSARAELTGHQMWLSQKQPSTAGARKH